MVDVSRAGRSPTHPALPRLGTDRETGYWGAQAKPVAAGGEVRDHPRPLSHPLSRCSESQGDELHGRGLHGGANQTAPHGESHCPMSAASVEDAVSELLASDLGSLVVYDGKELVGIFTKNDLVRCVGDHPDGIRGIKVSDYMKTDVPSPALVGQWKLRGTPAGLHDDGGRQS